MQQAGDRSGSASVSAAFELGFADGAGLSPISTARAIPDDTVTVVIPVAPGTMPARLADTILSVRTYMGSVPIVLVANGSDVPGAAELQGPGTVVTRAARQSTYGPLAVSLGIGFRTALEQYPGRALLRLDVDALATGPGLAAAIAARLDGDDETGLLGAARFATGGGQRNIERPAAQLRREMRRGDELGRLLSELYERAAAHGYRRAEHANGCVSVIAATALEQAADEGILGHPAMEVSILGEDILLALVLRALGYRIGEFAGEGDPLGVKWRGLPAAPPDLLREGRLAIHSVRYYRDWTEARIRAYFAGVRRSDARLRGPA